MNIKIESEKPRLKYENQRNVIKRKKPFQKKILNFKRKLYIIIATQQNETFTKKICSMRALIKIKKLTNVVHDESLNNRLINFKMCVTTERDTKSELNHILIDIAINKKRLRIMINSSPLKDFIATRYANYHELFIQRKKVIY